jgi:hypothetical protein
MDDSRGVSAYIDEMLKTTAGSYYVVSWETDLKLLKHYRWVRNQIVHDPQCDEDNMCQPDDAQWLDEFHSRIMHQTDPLAMYRKARERNNQRSATQPRPTVQPYSAKPPAAEVHRDYTNRKRRKNAILELTVVLLAVLLIMLVIVAYALFR